MLAVFIGLPLLLGIAGALITAPEISGWYLAQAHPPGTPPNWVFGPVWTALYILMGVAAWLVWRSGAPAGPPALRLWGWQLLANALWSPAFFGLHSPALALGVIAILLVLLVLTLRAFLRIQPWAGVLLAPYLAWVGFASWLNAGFWWLNRG